MSNLEPPDSHHFNAAVGWLELGLPEEARRELDQVSTQGRSQPDVLSLEWDLHARERHWTQALEVADRLLDLDRSRPSGWINRSYALHELHRTEEARQALLPAVPLFPAVGVIPYNLACYACQLGDLNEARSWLRQAMALDGRDAVIVRARHDNDLTPLKAELDRI